MKKLILLLCLSGCVSQETAVGYSQRSHPECSNHRALNHSYTPGDKQKAGSQTEVQMICDGKKKSITVKCIHGFGIISDTVCHENN